MSGWSANSSQLVVESLQAQPLAGFPDSGLAIEYLVIAPDSARIRSLVDDLLVAYQPDICLFTGQAKGRTEICLERFALNWLEFNTPDCSGAIIQGEVIDLSGPTAYQSNLPVGSAFVEKCSKAEIPLRFSNYCGNSVCNQLLYTALDTCSKNYPAVLCGFVHLPLLPEQVATQWPGEPCLDLELVRRCLSLLVKELLLIDKSQEQLPA